MTVSCPNPIIGEWFDNAYPGWTFRFYANGMIDATNGSALTLGSESLAEVIECIERDNVNA